MKEDKRKPPTQIQNIGDKAHDLSVHGGYTFLQYGTHKCGKCILKDKCDKYKDDETECIIIAEYVIGETLIGDWSTINVNNLISGNHILILIVIVAPDGIGTFTISLNDGWMFQDGTNDKTGTLLLNQNVSFPFIVP